MSHDKEQPTRVVSDRALEMIMRDVLDGMMELSLEAAFSGQGSVFQILDTPGRQGRPKRPGKQAEQSAEVIEFPQYRQAAC